MAGIVASTLRRRTFRHKLSIDARQQQQLTDKQVTSSVAGGVDQCNTGLVVAGSSLSPSSAAAGPCGGFGGLQVGGNQGTSGLACGPGGQGQGAAGSMPRSPSRTSSSVRRRSFTSGRSPGASRRVYAPKGAKLFHEDFWPSCANENGETDLRLVKFDSFDTLVPKANAWLRENVDVLLVKCETLEKKISSLDQATADGIMFSPKGNFALHVKGLRLWYVYNSALNKSAPLNSVTPTEIGYMNVIPKCVDASSKYPVYEDLPDTYSAINDYLLLSPLEGKVLTIETVPLKLPRKRWSGPDHVNPDQTYVADEYLHHVLYITRIYFVYGSVERELIGAQDFLPDFEPTAACLSMAGLYPKYRSIASTLQKAKNWIDTARNIRITNIQTLEATYRVQPENVHTGQNFFEKAESSPLVRFVRITYVRPASAAAPDVAVDKSSLSVATDDQKPETEVSKSGTSTSLTVEAVNFEHPEPATTATTDMKATSWGSGYTAPSGFNYRTFIPAAVKVGMCSGAPEYETFTATWERAKAWLKCIDRRVISVESFYHPLRQVWHGQDGAETTVMHGQWTTSHRREWRYQRRRKLVQIVRVYLDGDYQEPDPHLLPPAPMVEEVNDCRCTVM